MAGDECLKRIDAHMERGNEIMARSNEVIEQNRRAFEDNRRVIEENRQAFQDIRVVLSQITLRHEKVMERLVRHIDDVIEEQRAQRQALFRILDRLDGGGSAAGA